MNHIGTFVIAAVISTICLPQIAQAKDAKKMPLGTLECVVDSSLRILIEAKEDVACKFSSDLDGTTKPFIGTVTDALIDEGEIKGGVMRWLVFSSAGPRAALAGTYQSVEAPAELRLPKYSRVLAKSTLFDVILQPYVTPGDDVLNFAVAITALKLHER